ncbi:protein FAM193B isoform X2 [Pygocentrus nattereri]|uniref:FAM193 C-terminal domain-containing protein n=1 Tax=Pygocentrus nattereri TaxID=42514 RepID=A0A3B4DV94_PYGNA|nr:protein FAM193B isoform X2 [Pygocentrus nattereri]
MARKKSKQAGAGQKEDPQQQQQQRSAAEKKADGAAAGGGDAGLDRPARTSQSMHTCCLLCHREFKDWGAGLANGLPSHGSKLAEAVPALSQALLREVPGRKLADAVPSLSQSLLGEVPLWICQSCRKSVEEEERRTAQEQSAPVPLSHSSSCKSQNCGNGYPEQSSVDWDPSSFLSARKLSGLWNSAHSNTGAHCTHGAGTHSQQAGGTAGPTCHEKRSSHEASGTKICPYSHPASPSLSATSPVTPLSTSAELCKTTPKHFKTMCRRPTPPGEAFHPSEHHQSADLSVPPNSPTGLSSQNSTLLPATKPTSSQHVHVNTSAHAPFSPLAPNLAAGAKHSGGPDSPATLHKSSTCKNAHIPPTGAQHGKVGSSLLGCSHPCNGHNNNGSSGTVPSSNAAHLTSTACRDQACKGHKLVNGSSCQQAVCEPEEGEDEDSSSERSSCASSSTNQRDGKYCDCCYCEFFGHNAPPAAPTSRNYAEIREKLRSRLTRRKEELPQRQDLDPATPSAIDHRDVDELLDFINSTEPKPVNSAKAAKRARHKQKKKERERALQGAVETSCTEQRSSSPQEPAEEESAPDGEAGRLLEWPQLELERVNSFLTSRLEEIKNTIKDSIRASFSMYDLNLDVNDFPKKAATLEGNHLLSHLNGSSDLQQIDLDLAPLSLKNFKRELDTLHSCMDSANSSINSNTTSFSAATAKDVQRLHTTPSLSKLIRVRSPERGSPPGSEDTTPNTAPMPKPKDEAPDSKNATGAGAKTKKGKKQQHRQQQQDQVSQDQLAVSKSAKATPGNQEKTQEGRATEAEKGPRGGSKASQQSQQHGETPKTGNKKTEEGKSSKLTSNGTVNGNHHSGSNSHKGKNDTDMRGNRLEHEADAKTNSNTPANSNSQQQQSKGKNKKNKSKMDNSSIAIDDVFLPQDLDPTEMDEIDREVEYFKRFCLDSAKQTRQKVAVNWSNFSLKKTPSDAAQ